MRSCCGLALFGLVVVPFILAVTCDLSPVPLPGSAIPLGDEDWPPGQTTPAHVATEDPDTTGDTTGSGGSAQTIEVSGCEPVATPSGIRKEMYDTLNHYRVQNGVPTLLYSKTLQAAADAHARDMYQRDFFAHVDPDGVKPEDRIKAAGFCEPTWYGENIAFGYLTVAQVHEAWKNSPGHNENMLREKFTFVGMGYYASPTGVPYYVQNFGRSGR